MLVNNDSVNFGAIKIKGYLKPRDKKPVVIEVEDKQSAEILGQQGDLYIKKYKEPKIGPFAKVKIDQIDNQSELFLRDAAKVEIKKIDSGGFLELCNDSIAYIDTVKKSSILALNDSLLKIKTVLDGAEISVAHKAEAVIDNVKFKLHDVYSKIKIEPTAYFRIKKITNGEARNFVDHSTAIMAVEPPQPVK